MHPSSARRDVTVEPCVVEGAEVAPPLPCQKGCGASQPQLAVQQHTIISTNLRGVLSSRISGLGASLFHPNPSSAYRIIIPVRDMTHLQVEQCFSDSVMTVAA